MKMDKSKIGNFLFLRGILYLLHRLKGFVYILFAAFIIGFSNAFYNEFRWINDMKNYVRQQQVIDDEDTNV